MPVNLHHLGRFHPLLALTLTLNQGLFNSLADSHTGCHINIASINIKEVITTCYAKEPSANIAAKICVTKQLMHVYQGLLLRLCASQRLDRT